MKKILIFIFVIVALSCEKENPAVPVHQVETSQMIEHLHVLGVTSFVKQTTNDETTLQIKSEKRSLLDKYLVRFKETRKNVYSISGEKESNNFLMTHQP